MIRPRPCERRGNRINITRAGIGRGDDEEDGARSKSRAMERASECGSVV